MDLENFSVGIQAVEGWKAHPYGTWNATVASVKKMEVGDQKLPIIKISLTTSQGVGEHNVWLPTQELVNKCDLSNKEHPETKKLVWTMEKVKAILGTLGLATDDGLERYPWSQVMALYGSSVGSKCRFRCAPNMNNPKYQDTSILKFSNLPDEPDLNAVAPVIETTNAGVNMATTYPNGNSSFSQPGLGSIDNVPF